MVKKAQQRRARKPLRWSSSQNLNQLAKEGKIDPLIGRHYEVERTIQIPCRRRKNNPLLVGEAGWENSHRRGSGLAHHAKRRA